MFIAINYRRNSYVVIWSYSHHLSTYPVKIGIYNVLLVRSLSFNIICFRSDLKSRKSCQRDSKPDFLSCEQY